jgi:beta-lactamase class A
MSHTGAVGNASRTLAGVTESPNTCLTSWTIAAVVTAVAAAGGAESGGLPRRALSARDGAGAAAASDCVSAPRVVLVAPLGEDGASECEGTVAREQPAQTTSSTPEIRLIPYIRPMRTPLPALGLLIACAGSPAGTNPHPASAPIETLRARLTARIAAQPGAEVAVWFRDLAHKDSLEINSAVSFHAASTMKVPVMIELFRRVDAHTTSLDNEVFLENQFASIVDGSPFSLDAHDDSDSAMYARVGQNVSLRELDDHMITRSSNLATNAVIQFLDPKRVNATAHALGARDIQVLRGVEDGKAFAKGLNNTTTARDLGVLLLAIERGTAASRKSCEAMKEVLLRQEFSTEIPAGLPKGTPVAHKTGWITGTLHDAAIVYPAGRAPYVLVVLTRRIPEQRDAQRLIADISRDVYSYISGPR